MIHRLFRWKLLFSICDELTLCYGMANNDGASEEEEELEAESPPPGQSSYVMQLIMCAYFLFVVLLVIINRWLNRKEDQKFRERKELEDFGDDAPECIFLKRAADLKFVTNTRGW